MQIGLVGLGRMGGAMVRRLMNGGHDLVIFNRTAEKMKSFVDDGAIGTGSLEELVGKLEKPRVVWIMLPAGEVTEKMMLEVAENLEPDDIIIDGGNSNFKDDIRRANLLKEKGNSLSRCRNERRRVGRKARLLPDGWRRRIGFQEN
jgi:6-phosphogluconate dehydrogenase